MGCDCITYGGNYKFICSSGEIVIESYQRKNHLTVFDVIRRRVGMK